MNKLRKLFRQIRTLLWTALTLLTVLAAVLVGIGKLLMPYSNYYQPQLEDWLSKAFNQPVRVESFKGEWAAFGPRISLQGVIFSPQGAQSEIAIRQAALDIKPLNALIPGRPLYSFRIIGADLALVRTEDGRYLLSGLGVNNRKSGKNNKSGLRNVALNGEVRLESSSLSFDDPHRQIHLLLTNVTGRLNMDGQHLGAELQARVSDHENGRILGDLDAVIQVKLDKEQHLAKARWHVNTGELMLAELVQQLPKHPLVPVSGWLNAEIWGAWRQGGPQKMQGVVDLRDALWSAPSSQLFIDHLNSRFNWQFSQPRDWRIDLSELTVQRASANWHSKRLSIARNLSENLGLWVSSDFLNLDFPVQLAQRIMASYDSQWPPGLPRRVRGKVNDFDLILDAGWQLQYARGALEDIHLSDWDRGPEISGLKAWVDISNGRGDARFGGPQVKLDWPRVFRAPLTVVTQDCHAYLWLGKSQRWRADLDQCKVKNNDISIFGRLRMAASESKPLVDFNVIMDRGDISSFGDYWPQNLLSERTLHWLRTSLLGGQVEQVHYSMFGDMDDFPFKNHRGKVQAIVRVKTADISYAKRWPHLERIDAVAEFEGTGMFVSGQIGETGGASVDHASAGIKDFKKPVLEVEFNSSAGMSALAGFIKRTPLLDGVNLDPDQFVFTGPATITGHIHSKLNAGDEPLQATGAVSMRGAHFMDTVSGVKLNEITGILNYDRAGLKGTQFSVSYREQPLSMDITADWNAAEVFRADLHGEMPVDKAVPEYLWKSEPLFRHATGTSMWNISLAVKSVEGSPERETWLDVNSSLSGIRIALPAPLDKPSDDSWPLHLRYPIQATTKLLTADIPGHLQLKMELAKADARPLRAAIQLQGKVKELPPDGQFVVNGSAPLFDLDGWVDVTVDRLSQANNDESLTLQTANIQAEKVMIFNRLFDQVGMSMDYKEGIIAGHFDGKNINGTARYYKNEKGSHSLTGDFERLMLPDPVTGGVTMESDPAEMPEVHFYCKEFNYLGLNLGETRMEGFPVQNGYHISSLEAKSPQMNFNVNGDWLKDGKGMRSDFKIEMTSESLGSVLDAMDISSVMQGGQTVVHFDAWWHGPPAAFALERLNGEMSLNVLQGNIMNANSGTGRVLGLLSLKEIPRRLSMDFRDVFGSGFSFDEAKGTMHFENGTSFTDDLTLSSTAAQIAITGSADMVKQTFDYDFTVRPGVGKSFPVLGAIAGGPVGAAAGLAMQALFRNSLGDATEIKYSIRGPWSNPQVERLEAPPEKGKTSNNDSDTKPAKADGTPSTTAAPALVGEPASETTAPASAGGAAATTAKPAKAAKTQETDEDRDDRHTEGG